MFRLQRWRYRMHGILILGICLLLFSSVPPQTIKAATIPQEISNAIADFKDGQFQRAALANVLRTNPNDKLTDKLGGVQLGPVGLIKGWQQSTFRLPLDEALYSMGAAAIGSRIFIIGGRTTRGVGTGTRPLAEVWSVGVSTLDGALLDPGWQQETSLPAVQGSDQTGDIDFTAPVAEISSPAVTSTSDAAGLNGYIYVIGGNAEIGVFDFSSYAVRIGTVTNGHITGWLDQVGAHIPSLDPINPFILSHGAQQAQVVTAQVGGKTYVYLIGGLQRITDNNGNTTSSGLKTVFYAQVGAGGKLFKPSSPGTEGWDRAADIPVANQASVAGLWDASAVADNFVASNQTTANAIYVVGGQVTPLPQESGQPSVPVSYSAKVYRALINSNGSLDWNGWDGLLPEPRSQSTAIPFRGNIYMAGGAVNGGDAESYMLTSYVEDNLELHQFTSPPPGIGGGGTNFLKSNPNDNVLTKPRKLHGTALVRADANSPNSAFLFVLGGIGKLDSDPTDDNGANTVLYGKIGGGEDVSTTGYASDGWYYAQPFDVAKQFAQVQVQEIDWTTTITTADMDIALDYRLSLSNDCASATWDAWQPLDGAAAPDAHFSVNGENAATIANVTARCFQYRAHLTTTTNPLATPLLLNVSVKVKVPGGPDLNLASFAPQRGLNNTFLGLSVVIQNVNTLDPPTLAADVDQKGSFFVDLCIFGPGVPVVPPTLPLANGQTQCSKVYANVNRSLMTAGATYAIPQWKDTATNQVAKLIDYFKTPGTYKVIVAIDSFNNVDEGVKGGEDNNVSQAFSFDVTKTGSQLNLPLVRKP